MKKKIFNGLAMLLMMVMMYSNYAMAAQIGSGSVTVPAGCILVTGAYGVSRTTNYSYVQVKANSIYPTGNYDKDTFTKCKTVICQNDTNTKISDVYTLTEGSGYTNVYIYQGYLSLTKVNIRFAGNDPFLGAVVNFSYNGK